MQDATLCGGLWTPFLHVGASQMGAASAGLGGMGRAAADVTWEAPNKIH